MFIVMVGRNAGQICSSSSFAVLRIMVILACVRVPEGYFEGVELVNKLETLQAIKSRSELALLLGVKPKHLSFTLYKIPENSRYTEFTIPKASGGTRNIHAPNSHLKAIQSRTSGLLYECHHIIHPKNDVTNRELSHAFQKNRGLSIASNGSKHRNKRFVFNMDLKDFFGSFNFGRVRGFLLSNKQFGLHSEVATTLAQICCHENKLPQGAPTSPIVTEFITRILDVRLSKIAKRNGCTYSRYADDLTFSTNKRDFPVEVAFLNGNGQWTAGNPIVNKIHTSGFEINLNKYRMQFADSRQEATGLVVNEKVNVSKNYTKQVRYMAHSLFQKGECFVQEPKTKLPIKVSSHVLGGKLAHQFHIKSQEYLDTKGKPFPVARFEKGGKRAPAYYRKYADFIYFQNFFQNRMPTILCEGVTDNIYIKCAIKSLHSKVPSLGYASITKAKIELLCGFYNYSPTAQAVTKLTGGANPLKTFIETYGITFARFTAASIERPVIVVVDNDAANNGLWKMLQEKFGLAGADGSHDFYHVTKNLYVVPIPKVGGADTFIEHLFDAKTLGVKLNGKTFDFGQKGKKIAQNKYGKMAFAKDVIRKQRASIDFSGFLPLLMNVERAMLDHKKMLSAQNAKA